MFELIHKFAVRITAPTAEQRDFHLQKVMQAICTVTGGATVEHAWQDEGGERRGPWGYWGPTGEFEPSPVVWAFCEDPSAVMAAARQALTDWLEQCNQQAALVEIDGKGVLLEGVDDIKGYLTS